MEIPLWTDLYARRLDWAHDAYGKFLEGIDVALADEFRRLNEVTVVLYGPTQVGKTTLLLRLLGVSAEREVGRVLRGGRESAKSSTATAVRYSRSHDDHWYIGGHGTQSLSDEQAIDALAAMREAVETGCYTNVDPVAVSIPRKFFAEESPLHHVRVLDLPGFDAAPASSPEGVMVANVARKFLPSADLIILIVSVNDLGGLKPARLRLDELRDWATAPGRIRVVVTHTVSDASFRRWLVATDHPSKENVRALLAEEIRSLDIPLATAREHILYPLEYGKSWDKLRDSAPGVHGKAEPLIDSLLVDLYDDLRSSATLHGRLRMAFLLHHKVAAKVEKELGEFDGRIRKAKDQKARIGQKLKAVCGYVQAARASNLRAMDEESTLSGKLDEGTGLIDTVLVGNKAELPTIKRVRALSEFITSSEYELARQWMELDTRFHSLVPSLRLISPPRNEALEVIQIALSNYALDLYLFNYDRDRQRVLDANKLALQMMRQSAERQLRQAIDAWALRISSDKQKKSKVLDYIMSWQHRLKADWRMQRDWLREQICARAAYEEASRVEVERAKLFGVKLTDAFEAELHRRVCAVTSSAGPVETFLRLCYVKLLHSDYLNLKNGSLNA